MNKKTVIILSFITLFIGFISFRIGFTVSNYEGKTAKEWATVDQKDTASFVNSINTFMANPNAANYASLRIPLAYGGKVIPVQPTPTSTPTPVIQQSTTPRGWIPAKTYTGENCSGSMDNNGKYFSSQCQPYTYAQPAYDPSAPPPVFPPGFHFGSNPGAGN